MALKKAEPRLDLLEHMGKRRTCRMRFKDGRTLMDLLYTSFEVKSLQDDIDHLDEDIIGDAISFTDDALVYDWLDRAILIPMFLCSLP